MSRRLQDAFRQGIERFERDCEGMKAPIANFRRGHDAWDIGGFWGAGPTGHYRVTYDPMKLV